MAAPVRLRYEKAAKSWSVPFQSDRRQSRQVRIALARNGQNIQMADGSMQDAMIWTARPDRNPAPAQCAA